MGPYVDSMFYGQPIGMGETTIVADAQGRELDVGRRRDAHPLGQGPGRDRHRPAPVPDVLPGWLA